MPASAPPLLDVSATSWGLEYSIHECPNRHREDVAALFPTIDVDGMLIVPTCQRSDVDLVQMGEKVDLEKDRLLERFVEFAKATCSKLEDQGYWADYIDPCSGLPMIHRETGAVYGEVEGLSQLLGYKIQNAGCCKIILHPKWGSSVYPASMFVKAPFEVVHAAIKAAEAELAEQLA